MCGRCGGFLGTMCCAFCCPPCPSKVTEKFAFIPPEPSYALLPKKTSSNLKCLLNDFVEFRHTEKELDDVEFFFAHTGEGNEIACVFIRCTTNSRYTFLVSHGNATDLGQLISFYIDFGADINCNIFAYDYSGYGCSNGKPSEKNLYSDIDAALSALQNKYGVNPRDIILCGYSLGTAPTVDLAARVTVAGVILCSPLMSGLRTLFPNVTRTWHCDVFTNIDKVHRIMSSPVLVIHGIDDEVIDFSHGLTIYEQCPQSVAPLWIPGAGHSDVQFSNFYVERVKTFVNFEVPNWSSYAG